jgi:hypothetical protein
MLVVQSLLFIDLSFNSPATTPISKESMGRSQETGSAHFLKNMVLIKE